MPRVKLFANLRKVAGAREIIIKGMSVGEVLSELIQQHPELDAYLTKNGQIRPYIIITVNGQTTLDLDTPILEQDEIAIFPPIAGGFH
jgi:MoaD family protein